MTQYRVSGMFDVGLRPHGAHAPFARQLPFFNWFYPFAADDTPVPVERAFDENGRLPARRTAAYLHVPFCDTVCTFCPFVRGPYRSHEEVARYAAALAREIERKSHYVGRPAVDSIFIGGGTPSILALQDIEMLGASLQRHFDRRNLIEFSVEVEIKSATYEKLRAFRDIGVNRISFGVQTFAPHLREAFGLDPDLGKVRTVAAWCTELFAYSNVDIIYGIAGQRREDAIGDAEAAIVLGTTTIDFYPLNNLAAQARMHRRLAVQGHGPLDAIERREQRRAIDAHMRAAGYARINGYGYTRQPDAAPGHSRARPRFLYHDILYGHHDDAVIGYGAGAVSPLPGFNVLNAADRRDYSSCILDADTLPMAAYRTDGAPEKGIVTFPYRGRLDKTRVPWDSVPDETMSALAALKEARLIAETPSSLDLTEIGWLYYVNAMYLLMPEAGRQWISERIALRAAGGRVYEDTSLH